MVVLSLLGLVGAPALAAHQTSSLDASAVIAAGERFSTMVAKSRQRNDMPRLSDPAVASVFDRMASPRLLAQDRYTAGDFGAVTAICDVANRINSAYLLFGVETRIGPQTEPTEAARQMQVLSLENGTRFHDETVAMAPFLMRCVAVQAQLLTDAFGTWATDELTPVRIGGLRQAQAGATAAVLGALKILADANVTPAHHAQLLRELGRAAAPVANMLPYPARHQVSALALQVETAAAPELRAALGSIRQTFASDVCAGLCALADVDR
ncbi:MULTISPECIES: hypothetical protein [Luteimonas]|uniref:hypothetical protein n=1 Tax=Luteimonas TaxID=83614 RepID=UPI0011802ECE|nr:MULTISPECIES: hypothetical protein [Luteimonas]